MWSFRVSVQLHTQTHPRIDNVAVARHIILHRIIWIILYYTVIGKTHYIHLSLPQLYNVRFNFTITLRSILKDKLMHKISVTTGSAVSDAMFNALCHLDFIIIINYHAKF